MTRPTMRELIDALSCLTAKKHDCEGCPFNPHPGMQWPYGCDKGQNDIVHVTQALLRLIERLEDDLR